MNHYTQSIKTDGWLRFTFQNWSRDNYVLLPALAYDGNRFNIVDRPYPPMFREDEFCLTPEITMARKAHLSRGAESRIECCFSDLSVPCAGIFFVDLSKGFLVFSYQISGNHDPVLRFTETGDEAVLEMDLQSAPYRIFDFDCTDVTGLFERFFSLRDELYSGETPAMLPFYQAWLYAEDKYNAFNYEPAGGYYAVGSYWDASGNRTTYQDWQAGWVGGGMSSLPLLACGSGPSRERALETLAFAFRHQTPFGLFHGTVHQNKTVYDCFGLYNEKHKLLLIRKHADITYFIFKHFVVMDERGITIPPAFLQGADAAAGALVKIWDRYGQIGQFVNDETGEIKVGGSTSGAIAPAALALASERFNNEGYMETAQLLARQYYERDIRRGVTTGGPGEILQAPDSESAFGALESFVVLYERTRDPYWLKAAEDTARQCASWVVPYDFVFPPGSEFERLDVRTAGSVWANVQNQHSAPGICSLSASALLKLYRATRDRKYLRMMAEISRFVPQTMSHPGRVIHAWHDGSALDTGVICERVNMSAWEGKAAVGGVFNVSCWCEVSQMLAWMETPGIYTIPGEDVLAVADHVYASFTQDKTGLNIKNPTPFDAEVKILAESPSQADAPLGDFWAERFIRVRVPANGALVWAFPPQSRGM